MDGSNYTSDFEVKFAWSGFGYDYRTYSVLFRFIVCQHISAIHSDSNNTSKNRHCNQKR